MMEKSCGVVVIKDDKVLLIRQKNNVVGFPKGHVELGETEIQTAVREVLEETGIVVEVISNKRYTIGYMMKDNIRKEVVYFLGKVINDDNFNYENDEVTECFWVAIDDVTKFIKYNNLKKMWLTIKNDLN